jgi:hypothetical protein
LASLIEPDFFGCSGKLSFAETRQLDKAAGRGRVGGDYGETACDGTIVSSIDRVHRCARDWERFAKIALNHAFGDVTCAGSEPIEVMLSFEFGLDAEGEDAHAACSTACSTAFSQELSRRGIALGKCHSSRTMGVTAVTIATLASRPSRGRSTLSAGSIYLSRPIGASKLLYLTEMGIQVNDGGALALLERPGDERFRSLPWDLVTDVSGHGLLGAVLSAALSRQVDIDLRLSFEHAIADAVLSEPVECLQNPESSYGVPLAGTDPSARLIATLRETAGPLLGFIEDGSDIAGIESMAVWVGTYRIGTGAVEVSWNG